MKKINPLRARLDVMTEHTEAMLEDAERKGKESVAKRIREILAEVEKLSEDEEPLISEKKYNDVYRDLNEVDDDEDFEDDFDESENWKRN